jgi:hypothetical protein
MKFGEFVGNLRERGESGPAPTGTITVAPPAQICTPAPLAASRSPKRCGCHAGAKAGSKVRCERVLTCRSAAATSA